MSKDIQSPCVSLCHLKHEVCTGCGRSREEIREWKGMKNKDKKMTVERALVRLKDIRKKERKK